jgi:HEAT repeat protein
MGLFGPPNVEKLKAKGDITGLTKALSYRKGYWASRPPSQIKYLSGKALDLYHKDGQVRKQAAIALGQIGGTHAIEALVEAIRDSWVREAAVVALVKIGAPAVEALSLSLNDNLSLVRINAAKALGQIKDERAIDPLITLLKDTDLGVRIEAAQALEKLGWQPGRDENGAVYWAGLQRWERCVEIGSPALEALLTMLSGSNDWQLRIKVINALGQIGDQGAVEALTAILKQNDWNLSQAAATALGQIGSHLAEFSLRPRIVEALIAALKEGRGNSQELHKVAAAALGQIGDPGAIEALKTALKDKSSAIRLAAAEGLEKLDWQPAQDEAGAAYWATREKWDQCLAMGAAAVPALITTLTYAESLTAKSGAANALGEIGDPHAIVPLVGVFVYHSNDIVGEAAKAALVKFGAPAVPKLVSALGDENGGYRTAAGATLVKIGLPAVDPLIGELYNRRPGGRPSTIGERGAQGAEEALFRIGEPAVNGLVVALFSPHIWVRAAAANLLEKLGWRPGQDKSGAAYWASKYEWNRCIQIGPAAVDALVLPLRESNKSDVVMGASDALVKIGAPSVAALVAALKDQTGRQAAADVLGKIGTPSIDLLIATLKVCDRDRDVREVAAAVLDRIGWKPGQDESSAAYWIAKKDWNACIAIGAPAVGPLGLALRDPYGMVGKAAAGALGQIGDRAAVEPLIAAFDDKDKNVRQAAALALGQIGDPRAIEPLSAAIQDRKKLMWEAAAGALGQIRDPRVVDPLIAALADEKWSARKAAAGALIQVYQSGVLDEAHKQQILAQRGRMASVHDDRTDHFTNHQSGDCSHSDYDQHTDNQGIGVPFQV